MTGLPQRKSFVLPDASSVGRVSWLALLALQPYGAFGALRLLATLLLLVCLLRRGWLAARAGRFRHPDGVIVVGCLFVLWSIAVSLLGPYPEESLQALRKGLLPQVLLFTGGLVYVRNIGDAWRALAILLLGFALLTLLSLGEVTAFWWRHGVGLSIPRSHDSWWGGYGSMGACMLPLIVGWALQPRLTLRAEVAALALIALVAMLVFLYWSRTPLVTMVLAALLVALLSRRWRALLVAAAAALVTVATLALLPGQNLERYHSLLRADTYVSDAGLSLRPSLWRGVAEVIAERPLQGYGYGWKKLAWVVNENGFAARWRADGGGKAAYFLGEGTQAVYGRANPHSYFFQAAFEVGWIGLGLALLFWLLLIRATLPLLARNADAGQRAFAVALCGLWFAYWLTNITNGQWEGGLANITLALSASLLACRPGRRSTQLGEADQG